MVSRGETNEARTANYATEPICVRRAGLQPAPGRGDHRHALLEQTRQLYLADAVPWVVGYSGGKDSTAVLQLVWLSLAGLRPEQRTKPVHVISTDTLVENPVVAAWVTHSLDVLAEQAAAQDLPITPHRLTPAVTDTFWVNLIGRGYPAPRPKFRHARRPRQVAELRMHAGGSGRDPRHGG